MEETSSTAAAVLNEGSGRCKEEVEQSASSCDQDERDREPICESDGGDLQKRDILLEIFQYLDVNTLLQCRLVCSFWNYTIINAPKFIRDIQVNLGDAEEFVKSSIAAKAKHFRFHDGTFNEPMREHHHHQYQEFVNTISLSAESVTFDAGKWEEQQHAIVKVFSQVVSKCVNLKYLGIIISPPQLLECLSEELVSKSVITKLEAIELNTGKLWTTGVVPNLRLLLLKLPALFSVAFLDADIRITGGNHYIPDMSMLEVLLEHMKLYPSSIERLSFNPLNSSDWIGVSGSTTSATLWEFLLTAGKQNIKLDSNETDYLHLNEMAEYMEENDIGKSNFTEDHCRLIKFGMLTIVNGGVHVEMIKYLRLCTSLSDLHLMFFRCPTFELTFLDSLSKLETLTMFAGNPGWTEGTVGIDVFPPQLPSIRTLQISLPLLDGLSFWSFCNVFPNLSRLYLVQVNNLPEDLLPALMKMECLTELRIIHCNLTDSMVLLPCEIQSKNGDGQEEELEVVPAITAFKCLKELRLFYCPQLTDLILVQGLARSRTLETVSLATNTGQYSEEALNAVVQAGRLKRGDLQGPIIRFVLQ